MVSQCCVCKRIQVNGHWLNVHPDAEDVTHTYCFDCGMEVLREFGLEPKGVFDATQAA